MGGAQREEREWERESDTKMVVIMIAWWWWLVFFFFFVDGWIRLQINTVVQPHITIGLQVSVEVRYNETKISRKKNKLNFR